MKLSPAVIMAVSLWLPACPAFAAYPLATDDAGIVPRNAYELEASYDNFKDESDLANQEGGISFKHGITEKMDIGLSFPYRIHPAADESFGAAALSLKFSLISDVLAFSLANELGESEYFLNAVYTKEFSVLKLHLNGGYLSSGDDTVKGAAAWGLAGEYAFAKYEAVAELTGEEGGVGSALVGLRRRLKEGLFISAAVARALEADRYRVTGGFHFEF